MKRDERGRFVAPTAHRYALRYDDRPEPEFVTAAGPTQAVAGRKHPTMPHTITDLTAMAGVTRPRTHQTPLLDRLWGAERHVYVGDPR